MRKKKRAATPRITSKITYVRNVKFHILPAENLFNPDIL